jgi:hypothetical protein
MGVSTDAILGYGWASDEEESGSFVYNDEFYEVVKFCEKEFGVEIGTHCSGEFPMIYVADAKSLKRAWRGSVVKLDADKLEPKAKADERLRLAFAYLKEHLPEGELVETPKSFSWFLVSNWG